MYCDMDKALKHPHLLTTSHNFSSGHGAFHHACMGGDLDLVEALTARGGPGMPDLTGPEGGKLLNLACDAGRARVAEWLLKHKVRDRRL